MLKQEKTYVFIDGQNLHLAVKNDIRRKGKTVYKGWDIDYKRLYRYIKDKYKADKIFIFLGEIDKYKKLYETLSRYGYYVMLKEASSYNKNKEIVYKGNVDTYIVFYAMLIIKQYQEVIFVSGDGDFICLIDHWDRKDMLKRLLIPNRHSYSHLLQKYRRKMDFVSDLQNKIGKK
jgi:uncharacterized LabA/DUF88 family protein